MRKTKEILLILILVISMLIAVFPSVVHADERKTTETTIGGYSTTWSYIEKDGKAIDVKCESVKNGLNNITLILPKTLDGKDVIDFAPGAIAKVQYIASLQIPNTVTKIQDNTFASTKFYTSNAYLSIPTSVTEIGEYAFANCGNLNKVSISGNITELKEGTFQACSNLESITIPATVTKIADSAFQMCTKLKTVCGEIGSYAETWAKAKGYTFQNLNSALSETAPKVTEIWVVDPKAGTYNAPQTVKVIAKFSEAIKGTAPNLRIKFGTGSVKTVDNGTVNNTAKSFGNTTATNYVLWSYNIQNDDEGQLQIVSIDGGTLTGNSGVAATITTPETKGYAVVANKTGTVTNNTENQDKVNNETKTDATNKTTENTTKEKEKVNNPDPDNLISTPPFIMNSFGTIGINDKTTGYKLYYQYVELSETTLKKIEELNKNGSSKYSESITNLLTKYNDSKWIQSTDKNAKILDTSTFSGNKTLLLWIKLVRANGEIVYDWEIYTVTGTKATQTNTTPTVTQNTAKKDSTVANTILPKTGADVVILIAIGLAAILVIIRFIKCRKYRDIK